MHNTLGCILGYVIFLLAFKCVLAIKDYFKRMNAGIIDKL